MNGGLALLMVGDELLDGRSRDTNSDWIIEPDDLSRLTSAIALALD